MTRQEELAAMLKEAEPYKDYDSFKDRGCSCHLTAPCSFCEGLTEQEADIGWREGGDNAIIAYRGRMRQQYWEVLEELERLQGGDNMPGYESLDRMLKEAYRYKDNAYHNSFTSGVRKPSMPLINDLEPEPEPQPVVEQQPVAEQPPERSQEWKRRRRSRRRRRQVAWLVF